MIRRLMSVFLIFAILCSALTVSVSAGASEAWTYVKQTFFDWLSTGKSVGTLDYASEFWQQLTSKTTTDDSGQSVPVAPGDAYTQYLTDVVVPAGYTVVTDTGYPIYPFSSFSVYQKDSEIIDHQYISYTGGFHSRFTGNEYASVYINSTNGIIFNSTGYYNIVFTFAVDGTGTMIYSNGVYTGLQWNFVNVFEARCWAINLDSSTASYGWTVTKQISVTQAMVDDKTPVYLGFRCRATGVTVKNAYIIPVSLPSSSTVVTIDSRPSALTVNIPVDTTGFGLTLDTGDTISNVYNSCVFNEGTNTFVEPSTGTTYNITNWNYDYSTRCYNCTTDSGKSVSVTYGDDNCTVVVPGEGDTYVTNNYYYASGTSGSGSGGDTEKETIWDKLGNLLGAPLKAIVGIIEKVLSKLLDGLISLVEMLAEKITTVVEKALAIFDSIPSLFGGFLGFLGSVFSWLPKDIVTLIEFGLIATIFVGLIMLVIRRR